ncbi:MAG: hypothetical protein DYH17_02725 [Xanthomonadales bacterium PRO6]|nr:hypothetical protein [Xanthomonadales bacterium PRO6]
MRAGELGPILREQYVAQLFVGIHECALGLQGDRHHRHFPQDLFQQRLGRCQPVAPEVNLHQRVLRVVHGVVEWAEALAERANDGFQIFLHCLVRRLHSQSRLDQNHPVVFGGKALTAPDLHPPCEQPDHLLPRRFRIGSSGSAHRQHRGQDRDRP